MGTTSTHTRAVVVRSKFIRASGGGMSSLVDETQTSRLELIELVSNCAGTYKYFHRAGGHLNR